MAEYALAMEIADEHCFSLIRCSGVEVKDSIGRVLWYQVDPDDVFDGWGIERAVRYLKMRGLIKINRRHNLQVKLLGIRGSK